MVAQVDLQHWDSRWVEVMAPEYLKSAALAEVVVAGVHFQPVAGVHRESFELLQQMVFEQVVEV